MFFSCFFKPHRGSLEQPVAGPSNPLQRQGFCSYCQVVYNSIEQVCDLILSVLCSVNFNHQPGRAKTSTCFPLRRAKQSTTAFCTVVAAASHCSLTHSEKSTVCPLPHTWPQSQSRLSSVTLTNEGGREGKNAIPATSKARPVLAPFHGCGLAYINDIYIYISTPIIHFFPLNFMLTGAQSSI